MDVDAGKVYRRESLNSRKVKEKESIQPLGLTNPALEIQSRNCTYCSFTVIL